MGTATSTRTTVLSIPGPRVRVTLVESRGFNPRDLEKLKQALCVLAYVVNHYEFEDAVKYVRTPDMYSNHTWDVERTYTSTKERGHTVYERFIKANELGTTGDDNELDFSLQYYNSWWSRVVGYTLPKQLWIWLNWKYHLTFKSYETAMNLGHEQCHKLGYDHASASEHTSVPYAIGFLIRDLGRKYEAQALEWMNRIEVTEV